jgi:hypothetical protein
MASTEPAATPQAKPPSNKAKYTVLALFPFLLVTLFVGTFVPAMHRPTPNNLPVAVVAGDVEQGRKAVHDLEEQAGSALDVRLEASVSDARRLVTDKEVAGAYVLPTRAGGEAVAYVAGAAGASLTQSTTAVFERIAAEQHATLQTKDLAPLPERDSLGTVGLYMTIGFTVSGFLFAVLGSTVAPRLLEVRRLVPAAAGFAAFMAVAIWALTGPVIGTFEGHAAQVIGLGSLMAFSATMVTAFFARYLGPLASVPGVLLLMFLGVPSSNGALTVYAEPSVFQFLHDVLPVPATLEAIRSVLYFGSRGVADHVAVMAVWALAGVALNLVAETASRRKGRPAVRAMAMAH